MDNDKYVSMQIKCNVPTAMRGELLLLGAEDKKKYEYLALVKQNIEDFIKQGCSLYIYSRYPGNGKTSWAIKLLNEHIKNVCESDNNNDLVGLFVNVDELLVSQVKPLKISQYYLDLCKNVDLLILDDIGCSKITVLEEQILRTIINTRLLNGKATIYTSTVIDGDLDDNIGPRLANMVLDGSIIVELKNKPQRKPINIYDVIS